MKTLSKIIPWLYRVLIVGGSAFMLVRLYQMPKATLVDLIFFTILVLGMGLYALTLTGILKFVEPMIEWLIAKGGLLILIFLLLMYAFLRSLK
jgi:hypothetical protein